MTLVDYPIPLLGKQDAFGALNLNEHIREGARVRVVGDALFAGRNRLALFGVNLGFPYISHRPAYEFLASMGVNCVRQVVPFRVWNNEGKPSVPARAAEEIIDDRFDKLCRQQKACEELGIYIILSDFAQGLGPPFYSRADAERYAQYDSKDASILGTWHPGVRELVMIRLRKLLAKRNPHTGRPFGASPALLGVQLTNEAEWFAAEPHYARGSRWEKIAGASSSITNAVEKSSGIRRGTLHRLDPADRLLALAKATESAYAEAKSIIEEEFGASGPLLIADSAPWAGPLASFAFASADVYGWNQYPNVGPHGEIDARLNAYDLRPEQNLDMMQARSADKPTILTECGEKLATGGMARLIADVTVRAASWGYSGVLIHSIFQGTYGENSGDPAWLNAKSPRYNFDLGSDVGALCAFQCCGSIFRNAGIPQSPRSVRIDKPAQDWARDLSRRGISLLAQPQLARAASSSVSTGSLSQTILLGTAGDSVRTTTNPAFEGNVERGHVRTRGNEIEWNSPGRPEEDWLFMRTAIRNGANLIVLVGRSKPDTGSQSFEGGTARLSGLIPNKGYGNKLLIRRPQGPEIWLSGDCYEVRPNGSKGALASTRGRTTLPEQFVRFVEITG